MNRLSFTATLAAALVLFVAAGAASGAGPASQKVFRCGPDGRVYSQTPCKDGYEVNAADSRSAEQHKAAEETVKGEEKVAREQQAREAAAAKQHPAVIANALARPAAPAASAAGKKKRASKAAADAASAVPAQP